MNHEIEPMKDISELFVMLEEEEDMRTETAALQLAVRLAWGLLDEAQRARMLAKVERLIVPSLGHPIVENGVVVGRRSVPRRV
jgi:hypothetical protein